MTACLRDGELRAQRQFVSSACGSNTLKRMRNFVFLACPVSSSSGSRHAFRPNSRGRSLSFRHTIILSFHFSTLSFRHLHHFFPSKRPFHFQSIYVQSGIDSTRILHIDNSHSIHCQRTQGQLVLLAMGHCRSCRGTRWGLPNRLRIDLLHASSCTPVSSRTTHSAFC